MSEFEIVDAHHHLWDLSMRRHPWLLEDSGAKVFADLGRLRRRHGIEEYLAASQGQNVVKSVHVEARWDDQDPAGETAWLQGIADEWGFPHGTVGYADLSDPDVETVLKRHLAYPNMRGVRMLLNWHQNAAWRRADRGDYLSDPAWRRGLSLLAKYGLSFDLQIFYQQMAEAARLAHEFPDVQFILDHAGMPLERDDTGIGGWKEGMARLADESNVAVKISGLSMGQTSDSKADPRPFVTHTIEKFGVNRCMFGSNFPVETVSYGETLDAYKEAVDEYTDAEQTKLFHHNAVKFYRL